MKTGIKTAFGKIEYSEQHELLTLEDKRGRIIYGVQEMRQLRDFLNQLDAPGIFPTIPLSEKKIVEQIDMMCTQSLDPETSNMWDEVKTGLMANRMLLKGETLKPLSPAVLGFLNKATTTLSKSDGSTIE